ncbi:hypothetical protein EUX98_g6930 [Antrodiella citrinella]|uniref:FHA domain-containing protein n=1 Tax=Antrodiella citrinella TaxID=2447956 RepID=A0A4S4MPJ5_9APHY|nr:hypothetical protein EUX98_g6930 [Antrodiella citrinella]
MWVCTGPFDGETIGVVNFEKTKLLKPGKTYTLGRKRQPLTVNHKSIHQEHIVIIVGNYSEENANDPGFIPTLEVINKGSKERKLFVQADDVQVSINPGSSHEMRDGDVFYILGDSTITVRWEKTCCYSSLPSDSFKPPVQECAALGISIVMTPHSGVTHHLVSSYTLKPAVAASLISLASLVKPDWLNAVLALGQTDNDNGPSALERLYNLPRVSEHRPDYSPSIPSTLRTVSTWEPDETRVDMLRDHRFIFIGEKGREASSDDKDLVKRGGGDYECLSVNGGRKGFHSVLAKGSTKGKDLILVADEHAMGTALGEDEWMEFVQEAALYRLKFVRLEKLVSAVVHVDMSYIDCKLSDSGQVINRFASPIPDVVPNTLAEEPSYAQTALPPPAHVPGPGPSGPPRKVIRRAGRAASAAIANTPSEQPPAPSMPPPESGVPRSTNAEDDQDAAPLLPPPPPKRTLVRRARTPAPTIVGIDDPSAILDGDTVMRALSPVPEPSDRPKVPPTPIRRAKRRLGATQASQADFAPSESVEPAHKKFKALFDESDPDRIAQSDMQEYKSMFTQKQSFTQSEIERQAKEEEESILERSQTQATQSAPRGQKRKVDGEDVEMVDEEHPRHRARTAGPEEPVVPEKTTEKSAKKTTEPAEKTKAKVPGKSAKVTTAKAEKSKGASDGKEDKDDAFLKAVASTKRGKKKEDDFDREFNNLRIAKPDLRRQEVANEWAVLEEFGDDGNLRGNFMVVVEMDVFRKEPRKDQGVYRRGEERLDWEGKPDFKKFKKKSSGEKRALIELVAEEQPEFNFGATDSQSEGSGRNKRKGRAVESDSDSDNVLPLMKRRNTKASAGEKSGPRSRAGSVQSGPSKPTQAKGKGKQVALVIESDDDESVQAKADKEDSEPEQRKAPPRRAATQTQTRRGRPVDDDSDDDELGFKGFGNQRKR